MQIRAGHREGVAHIPVGTADSIPVRCLSSEWKPRKGGIHNMAANNWTVYVPDRSAPFTFPKTMTPEEVKSSLETTGFSSVASAEQVLDGDTIRFRRVAGGTKGL